jgi:tRNA-2-methylthio-N6-dimethylallyladenosine synthase
MSRRYFIKTYGCQMNEYDSARMADVLHSEGDLTATDNAAEADVLLMNTCSVREKAQEKVFSLLGEWRKLKALRPEIIIGVGGCVASQEGEAITERAPFVDLVFGPQTLHRLPEMIAELRRTGRSVVDVSFPEIEKFDHLPAPRAEGSRAFVSIMEGCSKYCSFCIVPYTRGDEISRSFESVLEEVRQLASQGVQEITLLGQNVNAYHGQGPAHCDQGSNRADWGLGALIRRLASLPDLLRLRYTTSHPADMDEELIAAHGDEPKLMPHLHLPVQSGSDVILAAMNRRHSAEDYRKLVARLRRARSDLALTSDFIVGFPGESAADFAATLDLVRDIGFCAAYSFKFSPRPGTPAAAMENQVPETVKTERLARLQALIALQTQAFNRSMVGRVLPVLFERPGRHAGQLVGRSPYLQGVHAAAPVSLLGTVADVAIEEVHANSLAGRLSGPATHDAPHQRSNDRAMEYRSA